eukprot:GEMP01032428.1.p1 GENE.GEMP01032428.1~~GEMP01032428.1.p1  ORF type:complete len:398 (+),score=137.83 GEMP01032428.1:335-1528(+)
MDHELHPALPTTDWEEQGVFVKNGFIHYADLPAPELLQKNVSCPGPGSRRRYAEDDNYDVDHLDHAAAAARRVEVPARPETIRRAVEDDEVEDDEVDVDHGAAAVRRVELPPPDEPARVELTSLDEPARVVMAGSSGATDDYHQWKFEAPGGGADRLLGAGGRSVPAWLADNMEGDHGATDENEYFIKNTFLHFDFEPQPLTKITSCPPQWTYGASFDDQRLQPSILSPMESVPEHDDDPAVVRPVTYTGAAADPSTAAPGDDPSTRSQRKLVCTFWVGIEDDDMFRVAKRLIGPQGKYLKRIADVARGTRLRLRGRGSSPNSPTTEPLHLRVSSPHIDSFHLAKKRVVELLARIYADYYKMTGLKILPNCVDDYAVPVRLFLNEEHQTATCALTVF